jgi:hypothetical protein
VGGEPATIVPAKAKSQPFLIIPNPSLSNLILADFFEAIPSLIPADTPIDPILAKRGAGLG